MSRYVSIVLLLVAVVVLAEPPRGIHPVIDLAGDDRYVDPAEYARARSESADLFGGLLNGKFVNGDTLQAKMKGGEQYRLYSTEKFLGLATGDKPEIDELGHATPALSIRLPAGVTCAQTVIGICGDWNALPRVPKKLDPTQPAYVQIVRDLLLRKGLKDPQVSITQLWSVDLEGDGQEEVIIAATTPRKAYRECSTEIEAGDYSMVLLRKIVKGKVQTISLHLTYFPTKPPYNGMENIYDLTGVFDVDGDGAMEIMTHWRYHEGFGHTLHRIKGATTQPLSTAGTSI